jgi:hypothetical protein
MRKRNSWVIGFIISLAMTMLSCSQAPSEETIRKTVTEQLNEKMPASWIVGAPMEGMLGKIVSGSGVVKATNVEINLIEIKQRGNFNEQGKYWPVKVRVKGTCQRNVIGNKVDKAEFDQTGDFKFLKDDYGNWKASIDAL